MFIWLSKENDSYYISKTYNESPEHKVEISKDDVIKIFGELPEDKEFPLLHKV